MGVGDYSILEIMAQGSEADIFKAKDKKNNELCIIKRYRTVYDFKKNGDDAKESYTKADKNKEIFQREVRALETLSGHDNFLECLDHFTEKDELDVLQNYIVFKYEEGESCEEMLNNGYTFTNSEIAHIMVGTLVGLMHLHDNTIIHRDIKPGHIYITKEGKVKYLDYGMIKDEIFSTNNTIVGTINYWAPETVKDGENGNESDIYSLGLSLYDLVTGKMRKAGDKIDDKVLSKFPLGHVIEKMTKKDRKERYKFAENILEEIFDNHSIVRKYGEVETVVNFIQGVKNESIDSFFLHKRSEHNSRYNWKVDAFYNGIEKKFGKDYIKKLKDLEKKIKRGEAFQKGDIGLGCVSAGFGAITWFGAMGWVLNGSNPHVVYGIPLTLMLISVITGERRTSSKNIEAGKNLEKNLLEMYKMRSDIARKVEPEIDEKNLEGMQNYFNKYNTFIENQKTQQVIDPEIEAEFQEVRKQIAYVKANAGKEKQLQVQEIEQIKLDKIKEKEDKKKEKEFEEAAIIRKEYEDSKKPHIEL